MYDANRLIKGFQSEHVALSQAQSQDMHRRRDASVSRLKSGLAEMDKPSLAEEINQGGNAMRTMTQPPEGAEDIRYDIDVAVVFEDDDTKTPTTTKGWVRDAIELKGGNLKNAPEAKKKCVRITYSDGYQVDLAVFRRRTCGSSYAYEIAVGGEWAASDPKAINAWLDERVRSLSPETEGYQLRRIVRLIKYFAKLRAARIKRKFPAGLVVTALAVECYQPVAGRDDEALYLTLKALSTRSEHLPVIANGTDISSSSKDPDRIRRLREAAENAVEQLSTLVDDEEEVSDEDARKAWKRVLRHSYFDSEKAAKAMTPTAGLAAPVIISRVSDDDRRVLAREEAGAVTSPTRPWAG